LEQEIRKSLEGFSTRVRNMLESELDTLASELMQAVDVADRRARAEAEARHTARENALRAELERRLALQLEEGRVQARAEALDQARAEALEQARAEASAAQARHDAADARATERDARLESIERLLASVRRIDAASTLRETLEVLAQSASLETPRVAVLLIEGNTVRPFSQRGFTDMPAAGPLAAGGVVEACVKHGQAAFTNDAAALKAPGFAALPDDRAGFAAPLRVGHRTVAVLYADDAGGGAHDAPAAWPEALELLARHASIHLENMTATRTAAALSQTPQAVSTSGVAGEGADIVQDEDGARRYARLLISEIRLYHEHDVRLGREHRDLRRRLSGEIDRARRAYDERVPASMPGRDEHFESELVSTLADGDPSIL
jgi:hypothetical protein